MMNAIEENKILLLSVDNDFTKLEDKIIKIETIISVKYSLNIIRLLICIQYTVFPQQILSQNIY